MTPVEKARLEPNKGNSTGTLYPPVNFMCNLGAELCNHKCSIRIFFGLYKVKTGGPIIECKTYKARDPGCSMTGVTKFKPTKQGQIYTLQTSTYLILQTNPLPLQISNGENMTFLWVTKLKLIENQKGLALQRWI